MLLIDEVLLTEAFDDCDDVAKDWLKGNDKCSCLMRGVVIVEVVTEVTDVVELLA